MIFVVANILVITAIAIQLYRREDTLRRIFWPALFLKIFAGVALGFIYFEYYGLGDTIAYFSDSVTLTNLARENFADYILFLWSGSGIDMPEQLIVLEPRALFLTKIGSVFSLFTMGNYWLISAWFSLVSFVAIWMLLKELIRYLPKLRSAASFAFLFFPSVVLWSSGFIKECLAFAAMCWIVTCFLRIRSRISLSPYGYALLVLAIWILWNLKYYYLIVLLPIIVADVVYDRLFKLGLSKRSTLWRGSAWLAIMVLPMIIVAAIHPNFHPSVFLQVVVGTHDAFVALSSNGDFIEYHDFKPTVWSVLMNSPVALFSGLFRPLPGETTSATGFIAAVENLVLIVLFIMSVISLIREKAPFTRDTFLIILYCAGLCTFLALSAPNFGSLSRYRVAFLPFFVMLLCYRNFYVSRCLQRIF